VGAIWLKGHGRVAALSTFYDTMVSYRAMGLDFYPALSISIPNLQTTNEIGELTASIALIGHDKAVSQLIGKSGRSDLHALSPNVAFRRNTFAAWLRRGEASAPAGK
jgi:hypothetical protein